MFVEIAARTNFSFLRGGSSPRALLERAAALGYDAIGVADCDGLYGMVRALEAADETGVRLVVGSEIAIDPPDTATGLAGAPPFLWLHVASREGYGNLCRILTESHERHPKGKARGDDEGVPRNQFAGLPIELVCANAPGLWCTAPPAFETATRWAPPVLVRPSGGRPAFGGTSALRALKEAFGDRLSLAAWRHLDGDDDARVAVGRGALTGLRRPRLRDQPRPLRRRARQARLRRPSLHPRGRHARRGGPRAPAQRGAAPARARRDGPPLRRPSGVARPLARRRRRVPLLAA
jgi:error-prone DNA polymerase